MTDERPLQKSDGVKPKKLIINPANKGPLFLRTLVAPILPEPNSLISFNPEILVRINHTK